MTARKPGPRFVVCIRNSGYPASLEVGKIYRLMPDREAERRGLLRVADESGEDYLFPKEFFVKIQVPQAAQKSISLAN